MRNMQWKTLLSGATLAVAVAALVSVPLGAQKGGGGKSGTTLAASKTIDICTVDDATWRYSGEVSVWNEGAVNTEGFNIQDCIQNKVGSGQFVDQYCQAIGAGSVIPAGTTLETATVFPYSYTGNPLDGYIRNFAKVTIMNHSGQAGKPFGPEPKATYLGPVPPPACDEGDLGCAYTIGYWGNHHEAWPAGYSADTPFFSSGYTWGALLPPINEGANNNGYIQLARQYVAVVLNQVNGASVPAGIQDILDLADTFFLSSTPASCPLASSCGLQKTWAGILDTYNRGLYPDGPPHCGDE